MFRLDEGIKFQMKKNDILTVGELLIDMISEEYDEDINSNLFHKYFGSILAVLLQT